jgi:N6-L-threonylcarbamoyladenine synthase
MIVDINDIKDRILELEGLFKEVFSVSSIEKDLSNNPFSHYLVYLDNDEIVGFINYYDIYDRVEIANFNVLESYQNKGIGNKLIKSVIDKSKEKENITLEVRCDNKKAIHIYEKYGFIKTATRKNYYNGVDGILMEMKLMKEKDIYVLGIESSCDETSFSIVKNGTDEIATIISSQIDIHKDYGGVVPEIASRAHVKNITFVIEELLEKANMTMDNIDMVAVANGPGLIGSLLVGLEAAKTIAWLYNKPLIPVHHIAGHIYANNLVKRLQFPLLCLVISGGHTELVYMDKDYSFKKLGGTLDDAVGECYDKVGKVIGVDYPAGPKIDKMAKVGSHTYQLPLPLNDDSYNFSFSGLKSAVINLVHNEEQRGNEINKENLATSFQETVVEILAKKTVHAIVDYDVKNLILAGGVSANSGIRKRMEEICNDRGINYTCPEIKYCTDNAAMIASAGYYAYLDGRKADFTLNGQCSIELK